MQKIIPFLWFDKEARAAAEFYTAVFKDAKIISTRLLEGTPSGTVEIVVIELFGQTYQLMSAGPLFKFNESISFVVNCEDQEEVDYYWRRLSEGGEEGQCGWLKDKYGVSWQVVPSQMGELMGGSPEQRARVTRAFLKMKKFDIAALQRAAGAA
ncbi:MAG: VOC family protein [Nitrosomonadales bacterium]|nr:VOC family protein [Nitrosomonadales bacterium]